MNLQHLLQKLPSTDTISWRSLYLELGSPNYQNLLFYLTKSYISSNRIMLKEWLNSKDINIYIKKQLEDKYHDRNIVIDSNEIPSKNQVTVSMLLQSLYKLGLDKDYLIELIVEDFNEQFHKLGFCDIKLIERENIKIDDSIITKSYEYTFSDINGRIYSFSNIILDLGTINKKIKAYLIVAKIEYKYFRQLFHIKEKEWLFINYTPENKVDLYHIMRCKNEQIWETQFKEIIIEKFLQMIIEPLLGSDISSKLRNDTDFMRDLILRAINGGDINIKFLISNISLRY